MRDDTITNTSTIDDVIKFASTCAEELVTAEHKTGQLSRVACMVLCTLNNTLFVVTTLPLRDTLHTQFQLHVPSSSFLVCSIACNSYSQNHNFI
jgi:hypothetical protein